MSLKRASPSDDSASESKRHAPMPSSVTLRALIESNICARIIGPRGDTLRRLRSVADETGQLMARISPENGAHLRVLTVAGSSLAVGKFFGVLVRRLLDEGDGPATSESRGYNLRLLVPHSLMGKIIGSKMTVMRRIEEESSATLTAERERLPHSDDRLVGIYGVCDAIHIAAFHIGEIYTQNPAAKGKEYIPEVGDPEIGGERRRERKDRADREPSNGRQGSGSGSGGGGGGGGEHTEVGKRLAGPGPAPAPSSLPGSFAGGNSAGSSSSSAELASFGPGSGQTLKTEIELHVPESAPRALQTAFETAKQTKKSSIRQIIKIKSSKIDKLVKDIAQVTDTNLAILDDEEGTIQIEGPPEENQLAIFLAFRHLKRQ